MSSETESKLSELFARLPQPDPEVSDRALVRALAAVPTLARRSDRSARAVAFVLAAAVALLAVAAGSLAAVGALHVSLGEVTHQSQRSQISSQLAVPAGARGIAVTVNGRLWLTTSNGLRLQGLPVSAAALSPHALYVAVGVGSTLVAMAPNGRRAWSFPTAGRVAAIAWAPDALRIAYVVDVRGSFRLYAIEGNGRNNQLIDAAVRSARPAWRADSLAIAYVAAGGRAAVYDYRHNAHAAISAPAAREATFLAFASHGNELAIGSAHRVVLWRPTGRATNTAFADTAIAGLGWMGDDLAVALNRTRPARAQASLVRVFRISPSGAFTQVGQVAASARIEALDASASQLTVGIATRSSVRVLSAPTITTATNGSLLRSQPLLQLPAGSRIGSIAAR